MPSLGGFWKTLEFYGQQTRPSNKPGYLAYGHFEQKAEKLFAFKNFDFDKKFWN